MMEKLWTGQYAAIGVGSAADRSAFFGDNFRTRRGAFLCSPFEEFSHLPVDGVGEWMKGGLRVGRGTQIQLFFFFFYQANRVSAFPWAALQAPFTASSASR